MPDAHVEPSAPPGVDLTRPSSARVYDYLLGGTANWAVDREFGDQLIEQLPLVQNIALANRMFLNRVVRHLTKLGIRQFLDIGAGVPTAGNTHQIADQITPTARVVYADNEPVAVAHAEMLLDQEGDPGRHAVINADLHEPDVLWEQAFATGILDPDEPIALLMIAVLHFFRAGPDGRDIGLQSAARYRELVTPGSYIAISHITDDGVPDELVRTLAELRQMYDQSVSSQVIFRPRAEIDSLLGEFEILKPGMVWTPEWHPEESDNKTRVIDFPTPSHAVVWAGVGRKTAR